MILKCAFFRNKKTFGKQEIFYSKFVKSNETLTTVLFYSIFDWVCIQNSDIKLNV